MAGDDAASTAWDKRLVASGQGVIESAALALSGGVHVLWQQDRFIHHTEVGGAAAQRICAGMQPALSADASGQLHAAFVNDFSGQPEIYISSWDETGWSFPYRVSSTLGAASRPALAVDETGVAHLAWEDTTPGFPNIYYASNEHGVWRSQRVTRAAGRSPALAVDDAGRVHIVYQSGDDGARHSLVFAVSRDAAGWSDPQKISLADAPAWGAMLASDATGRVYALWREDASRVRCAVRTSDAWVPRDVPDPDAVLAGVLALASDASGGMHVLWASREPGLYYGYRPRGDAQDDADGRID